LGGNAFAAHTYNKGHGMILGIDLGTTNSVAAIWRDGAPVLIPNRLGHVLTPSAVSIDDDGVVTVGLAARERQVKYPGKTATAFKRYMGTNRRITLGRRDFAPEDLSALVLRSLKEDAEAFLGEPVTEAVITVPAYFNDKQRKATRRAGLLAGLKVERLINEPTAAALAYGIHKLADHTRFLVFDLGGGTFDVSVLEIYEGIIEVRSSTGDNQLGGEDFNTILIQALREKFGSQWGADLNNPALHERIREQAEKARRALSASGEAQLAIEWQGTHYEFTMNASELEVRAAPLLARLKDPVLRALRDSGLSPDALAEIVLIGGATRMPIVHRAVTKMFGRFPNNSINPDEAVALGAAIQAGLKSRDEALSEIVLTDVCPYSLGVNSSRRRHDGSYEAGIFTPIIERNTVVPASREKEFCTLAANQPMVKFEIFQGEDRHTQNNVKIGAVEIAMPAGPAGQVVNCRFSYDINGLLEVDLSVAKTGERRQLVIAGDVSDAAELEKTRQTLAALKVHPRDTEAVRTLVARAERCWEISLAERRAYVEQLLAEIETAVASQDPKSVAAAVTRISACLDQLDGESFL
jgi:molecular chaperone HscC